VKYVPIGLPPQVSPLVSSGSNHLDGLVDDLALLIGRKKRDIGCVAAAADPDNPLDRRLSRGIDQPSAVLDQYLEDRMKVPRLQVMGKGPQRPRRYSQRSSEMREAAAHPGSTAEISSAVFRRC
jgi:hypothetical protein